MFGMMVLPARDWGHGDNNGGSSTGWRIGAHLGTNLCGQLTDLRLRLRDQSRQCPTLRLCHPLRG